MYASQSLFILVICNEWKLKHGGCSWTGNFLWIKSKITNLHYDSDSKWVQPLPSRIARLSPIFYRNLLDQSTSRQNKGQNQMHNQEESISYRDQHYWSGEAGMPSHGLTPLVARILLFQLYQRERRKEIESWKPGILRSSVHAAGRRAVVLQAVLDWSRRRSGGAADWSRRRSGGATVGGSSPTAGAGWGRAPTRGRQDRGPAHADHIGPVGVRHMKRHKQRFRRGCSPRRRLASPALWGRGWWRRERLGAEAPVKGRGRLAGWGPPPEPSSADATVAPPLDAAVRCRSPRARTPPLPPLWPRRPAPPPSSC